ncbi:MAG: hypothetical protein ACOYBF_02540 [Bilifractor porci]
MKGKKITLLLAAGLSMSVLLSGCSFAQFTEKLINIVEPSASGQTVSGSTLEGEVFPDYIVNESIEAPTFTQDLSGTVNVEAGSQTTLTVAATASGGEISYQWYSNNVNANGGGTLIEGATEASYSPVIPAKGADASASAASAASSSSASVSADTSGEAVVSSSGTQADQTADNTQTTYYYAVAINTVNGEVNMTTSQTIGVTVWDNMYWAQSADNGGYQYVNRSTGKFPTNTTMTIDGVEYTFNADGYIVDANGNLLDYATGQQAGGSTASSADASQAAAQSTDQAAAQSTDQAASQSTDQASDQAADQGGDTSGQ